MKTMKISISVVILALVLTLALPLAAMAHDSKVGFLNPQMVVLESKMGKFAQEDLARMGREKDRQVTIARNKALEIKEKLNKGTYGSIESAGLEEALQQATRDYERLVDSSREELKAEERRLVKFVMNRADAIMRRIAQEEGFTLILTNPDAIGYIVDSVDITERVIRELDATN